MTEAQRRAARVLVDRARRQQLIGRECLWCMEPIQQPARPQPNVKKYCGNNCRKRHNDVLRGRMPSYVGLAYA